MSQEVTRPSSLGVEEVIATITVLILASIFIGYYLWPEKSAAPQFADEFVNSSLAPEVITPAETENNNPSTLTQEQNISIRGNGKPESVVKVQVNGDDTGSTRVDSFGKWEVSSKTNSAEDIRVELSRKEAPVNADTTQSNNRSSIETRTAEIKKPEPEPDTEAKIETKAEEPVIASLAEINNSEQPITTIETPAQKAPEELLNTTTETETTIETESEPPVQVAMIENNAATADQSKPENTSPAASTGTEITEPVITFLDRDRTTNELVISGTTSTSLGGYVVLLINGTTTKPVKSDAQNKWRYRFKAGPGEYYIRVMDATEKGPIISQDALPTLYNISLSPVTPESTEAGAEISLLAGEFKKIATGETLFQVSQQTGIRVEDLMLVNGITRDADIKAGDVLFIPSGQ